MAWTTKPGRLSWREQASDCPLSNSNFKDCPICASRPDQTVSRLPIGGDALIVPRRHVSEWQALNGAEQMAFLGMLGDALSDDAHAFESDLIAGHFVVRISLRVRTADKKSGALIAGGDDPLFDHLVHHIDNAVQVDLAVAFALESGVAMLIPRFRDLLDRGGRLRLVVGDYLDVTEPAALRMLTDLSGDALVRIFETGQGSFHPKAWVFRAGDGAGSAIVGSSNLTRTALTQGIEWNLHTAAPSETEDVRASFEALLAHPAVRPLTPAWIDTYAARRKKTPLPEFANKTLRADPPEPVPTPHGVQREALEALAATRAAGHRAGLVVMATGLGKTWLAAFDSLKFDRVLFVAHRAEILSQAMATFRRIRPEARMGRYDGVEKGEGDILFASVQTLGRADHLQRFDPDAFDYVVLDEFHHAAAPSYQALLDHFTPQFLLGLTATPDRTDGADLLSLCGENLVYRCDLHDGITRKLLAPFAYYGIPDDVDYQQIPWRSSRFDPEVLTTAVATRTRADNALDEFRKRATGPAIGFCVSVRHAEFMAEHFRAAGFRAVAVHSEPSSAPRTTSLEKLDRGEIDILFAIDMFNEGVDLPNVGTVMMLRPTESTILFLQQLGRGLRKSGDKVLQVIDYIGNHRVFLTKARALLQAGAGDRALIARLNALQRGEHELPPGCSVTYELQALDMLKAMLKRRRGEPEAEAWYRDFRLRNARRPQAGEFAHAGFDPAGTSHGGWFDLVASMGDPVSDTARATHGALLELLERGDSLSDEALRYLLGVILGWNLGRSPDRTLAQVAARYGHPVPTPRLRRQLMQAWEATGHFKSQGEDLALVRPDTSGELPDMLRELLEWRLGDKRMPVQSRHEVDDPPKAYNAGPFRRDIQPGKLESGDRQRRQEPDPADNAEQGQHGGREPLSGSVPLARQDAMAESESDGKGQSSRQDSFGFPSRLARAPVCSQ